MTKRKRQLGFCIFPGYKWCGPGCSGPGNPINDVDACCKAHDECLNSGRSQCECDREFRNCLRPKINFYSKKGIIASIMYFYIKIQIFFTCILLKK